MIDQDIQRRMDAYRGNPQALMQRYQQSQQLIDLLALQKLKSEKEAAARSLQMAATQGQGEPPTIAQQREQEVMGLTQQEVARSVGAEAQQRAAREREALQRLMSGVASAPGAESVMPERAMAAGGIVAFQEGGVADLPPVEALGQDVDELRQQLAAARRKLYTYGTRQQKADPEGYAQTKKTVEELGAREKEVAERYANQMAGGIYRPYPFERRRFAPPVAPTPIGSPITAAPADYLGEPSLEAIAGMAPARTAPPPPAPRESQAAPAPEATPTTAELPAAAVAANPQLEELRAALMGALKPDRGALRQQYASLIPGLGQERMAARQRDIAELERLDQEARDPRQVGLDKLIAFLSGGANKARASSALGGAAQSYLKYSAEQQAAQRARAKELAAAREGLRALEEARELAQAQAGMKGYDVAEQGIRSAIPGAVSLAGTEMQTATSRYGAELQAETARLNEQSRALDRALARGDLDLRSAQSQYTALTTRRAQLREQAEKRLDSAKPMDIQIIQMKPTKTADDLRKLQNYEASRDLAVQRSLAETDRALAAVEAKLGIQSAPAGAAPGVNLPSASSIDAELRRRGAQ